MSKCSLYTPEQKPNRSDRQRHPTTLKPEEYALIPYAYAKENECGMIRWDRVVDDAKLWEIC